MSYPRLPYPPEAFTRGGDFARLLGQRILILDGAMGTMIQRYKLGEADFRGERFAGHGKDLKGDNELLSLVRPDVIAEIHRQYLEAGADVIETNTFGATSIAQGDYDLPELAYELNLVSARLAREACDAYSTPDKPRFVAGALGPQPKTASISPDVNDPGARNVTFDELRVAYVEQLNGLLDGGIDIVLIETIFDTLNAKAAIYATEEVFEQRGIRLPVMISGTVTDASGRILSGQTVEAFWNSVRHARPVTIGLNCALGAALMRPYVAELSKICDTYVCVYPNAGLPNPMAETGFDETPADTSALLEEFARAGLVNMSGGCCGTTPDHIRAIADKVTALTPRVVPEIPVKTRLSGLEPLNIDEDTLFVNVGERTNVTGSKMFARLIREEKYDEALAVARQQVENGAQIIDINMDEAMLDSVACMHRFLNLIASEPDIARVPVMIDSPSGSHRDRPEVRAGQAGGELHFHEGRAGHLPRARAPVPSLRRRRGGDGVRRAGPGRHAGAPQGNLRPRIPDPGRGRRLPARGHHLRSQRVRRRHRHRRAQPLRGRLHRRHALDPRQPAARAHLGRRVQRQLRSAATSRCAKPFTPCSCITRSRKA